MFYLRNIPHICKWGIRYLTRHRCVRRRVGLCVRTILVVRAAYGQIDLKRGNIKGSMLTAAVSGVVTAGHG
nr:MAG TPA: hypothetical protein [Caudoviricetes sp.]